VHIVDILRERFGVPCALRNDANACALAEWKYGAGKGYDNVIFFTFGTGLGAGLILNGRLYSGSTGNAGEAGHVRLSDFGPSGYGKCGSFEGFCSGTGIREIGRGLARSYIQRGITPDFVKSKGFDGFDVVDIANAAREGDPCAIEVFDTSANMLGKGLAMMADILDPDVIILGSVYARCTDLLEKKALEVLCSEALPIITSHIQIKPAELGESIGDCAALAVALEALN
jgi:glucokinase